MCLAILFPSCPAPACQRVGAKRPQLKVEDSWPLPCLPTTHPCREAGLGRAQPSERGGLRGFHLSLPQGARAHTPSLRPAAGAGRTALHRGRSQERQAARRPGRHSAVKCCISHKGGLQWALLEEIRETGNAEPSFNTHLIFMEPQQRVSRRVENAAHPRRGSSVAQTNGF